MPDRDELREAIARRAFWSGTITFGLVSVPVDLFAAVRDARVALRMVSPEGTPLERHYFTETGDRELEWDEIVRGYEIEKGRYVIVDDDELERIAPERTRDIDLRQFVELDEIDPIYFDRAYYLTPAGSSTKAYRLLAEVMEREGKAGIATFVMRAREYLVAILAENGILRAETLRFADEVRSPEEVGLPAPVKPKPAEVKKIAKLIEQKSARKPLASDLEDRGSDRLLKLARKKLKSKDDVVEAPEPVEESGGDEGGLDDLVALLRASLQGGGGAPTTRKSSAPRGSARKSPAPKTAGGKASARKASTRKRKTA